MVKIPSFLEYGLAKHSLTLNEYLYQVSKLLRFFYFSFIDWAIIKLSKFLAKKWKSRSYEKCLQHIQDIDKIH